MIARESAVSSADLAGWDEQNRLANPPARPLKALKARSLRKRVA